MELGNSLRGPELARGETRNTSFAAGVGDVFSISMGEPYSQARIYGGTAYASVRQLRLKAVIAKPFDRRGALALHAGYSWGDRFATNGNPYHLPAPPLDTLQDDRIRSWEVALPAEWRFGRRFEAIRPSVYLGPRLVYLRYDDRVTPDGTFHSLMPGALAGVHTSSGRYEVFLEGTIVYVPSHSFSGGPVGGSFVAMPSVGVVMRFGPPYRW